MTEPLQFADEDAFRSWLAANGATSGGVWLLFGKAGGPATLSAGAALEAALCYGWIDGQMKQLDDKTYIKYFAQRRKDSPWSDRNKALAEKLTAQGRMTEAGAAKIAEARRDGRWDKPKASHVTGDQIAQIAQILKPHEPAHTNFQAMSPSVQRTYVRAYFDAKTDAGRESRLRWMIDRLNQNLKPM